MGVVQGPLRATRCLRTRASVNSGRGSPKRWAASRPACASIQSTRAPAAASTCRVASITSGPMPSPAIMTTGVMRELYVCLAATRSLRSGARGGRRTPRSAPKTPRRGQTWNTMERMPFVFLLVFALISFQTAWPAIPVDVRDEPTFTVYAYASLLAPVALLAGFWGVSMVRVERFQSLLARYPNEHSKLWRRFHRDNRRQILLLTGGYLAVLFGAAGGAFAGPPVFVLSVRFVPPRVFWGASSPLAKRGSHETAGDTEPFVGP